MRENSWLAEDRLTCEDGLGSMGLFIYLSIYLFISVNSYQNKMQISFCPNKNTSFSIRLLISNIV